MIFVDIIYITEIVQIATLVSTVLAPLSCENASHYRDDFRGWWGSGFSGYDSWIWYQAHGSSRFLTHDTILWHDSCCFYNLFYEGMLTPIIKTITNPLNVQFQNKVNSYAVNLYFQVRLEWNALVFCSLGGMFGMIFGLYVVDPALKPAHKKMAFVCIWFSFAFALFLLNRYRKRRTFKAIPQLKVWKILVLLATGFMGGIFSSFAGSGLDICTFSVITLLFRVTEKTATPTSVVLMAGNTVVGFYWRQVSLLSTRTMSINNRPQQ